MLEGNEVDDLCMTVNLVVFILFMAFLVLGIIAG
jgi:hypothetical protein